MNVASPALILALIRADELSLMALGSKPPRDPDRLEQWRHRRAVLMAELSVLRVNLSLAELAMRCGETRGGEPTSGA